MSELVGHVSPDTAYVVADYPYGFRLRCRIRYWVETKNGHGQRVVSQTTNPKRGGDVWNKPKASTYSTIRALYLDDSTGHVENAGIGAYADEAELDRFVARFPLTCATERNAAAVDYMRARIRVSARVTWSVVQPGEERQSEEETSTIIRKLTAMEIAKIRAARDGGVE